MLSDMEDPKRLGPAYIIGGRPWHNPVLLLLAALICGPSFAAVVTAGSLLLAAISFPIFAHLAGGTGLLLHDFRAFLLP
jgi:hypothetical protein